MNISVHSMVVEPVLLEVKHKLSTPFAVCHILLLGKQITLSRSFRFDVERGVDCVKWAGSFSRGFPREVKFHPLCVTGSLVLSSGVLKVVVIIVVSLRNTRGNEDDVATRMS